MCQLFAWWKSFTLKKRGVSPLTLKSRFDAEIASGSTGLVVANLTSEVVVALQSVSRTDVPDMPDRIIAATAVALGLPLISRDHKIQASNVTTILVEHTTRLT